MNQEPRLNITDVTELVTEQYPQWQAIKIVSDLMVESCWFSVDPEPFDVYTITVKPEAKVHLPEALGTDGAYARVAFEPWIASFAHYFESEGGLSDERKEAFRSYFLRGLRPAEAIDQDLADAEA
ncbi:hypothetical protein LMG26857_03541 [Achromobacter anxifer]|uniref:hypothetical protein n=1 Tax=Achromobacter anxifer TaxID=1287737 RepID=UPI00155CFD47|nr:hypothetical protein [Achromobacter anxifer]CAB5514482.1 hypothetical protein LMG26857_03541 [Achromobacter anxifer]